MLTPVGAPDDPRPRSSSIGVDAPMPGLGPGTAESRLPSLLQRGRKRCTATDVGAMEVAMQRWGKRLALTVPGSAGQCSHARHPRWQAT
ncbi:hypothetical protein Cenrod_0685 [Candidatus Symbiobacter mobilis CR]|uniref:Uncharacterized protein n=1 Tax=Candidatus Symbiobacter mobilis CR TaxID=946483 RepID=U5N5Z9_9BURK|nr:hypothetical protein Cenrod_0685 [Candidatus Symbiobacter mobilis CR]